MRSLLLSITTPRLSLAVLTPELLAMMTERLDTVSPFSWPRWWPDEVDRDHLKLWRQRAIEQEANVAWGPRAIVRAQNEMIGHAGFHAPPQPIENALSDPTFAGRRDPARGGAVEIGYTIFPTYRHRGYATEAVAGLLDWSAGTGEVSVVLATVERHNDASTRVLNRVGDFAEIGTCEASDAGAEVVYRRDL